MTLIYKKGDRKLLKNYRPITLTTTDYKILAHIMADRLQNVMPDIINRDQAGYIKGRNIGNNIRIVEDLIHYAKLNNTDCIICAVDFEKAFDSLSWEIMLSIMKKYNFGPNCIKWISVLYTNPTIQIKNNGWMTNSIDVKRGVKQGDPCSSLLFILAIEALATKIRQNKAMDGIKIKSFLPSYPKNSEIKTTQYADDIMVYTKTEAALHEALEDISLFEKSAGLKLNLEKSEIIAFGSYSDKTKICAIDTVDNFNCLGIPVGKNAEFCIKKNWYDKIAALQNTLAQWKKRNLTLFGKVLIIKALALSKLIFSAQNTAMPNDIIKITNSILYNFLWNNTERIKRKILTGPYSDGGIKMIDLESFFAALKAKWVGRIVNDSSNWSIVCRHLIEQFAGDQLLIKINSPDVEYLKTLPPFYEQILHNYIKITSTDRPEPNNYIKLMNQPLWGNKHFFVRTRKMG